MAGIPMVEAPSFQAYLLGAGYGNDPFASFTEGAMGMAKTVIDYRQRKKQEQEQKRQFEEQLKAKKEEIRAEAKQKEANLAEQKRQFTESIEIKKTQFKEKGQYVQQKKEFEGEVKASENRYRMLPTPEKKEQFYNSLSPEIQRAGRFEKPGFANPKEPKKRSEEFSSQQKKRWEVQEASIDSELAEMDKGQNTLPTDIEKVKALKRKKQELQSLRGTPQTQTYNQLEELPTQLPPQKIAGPWAGNQPELTGERQYTSEELRQKAIEAWPDLADKIPGMDIELIKFNLKNYGRIK